MKSHSPASIPLLLLAGTLLFAAITILPQSANAQQTYTWSGGGTAAQGWGNSNHWVGNPALTFDQNTTVIFNAAGAGNLLNGFGENRTIGHLIFNENADSPVAIQFTVHGTNLAARNLTMGGPDVAPTITVDAGAGAAHEMGVQGGNLILANNLTVQHDGSHTLTISQPITQTGGSRSLTKEGAGTLVLSGASSYSGGTVINEGLLIYSNTGNNSLGADTGTVAVNSTVRFNNTGTGNFIVANPITGGGTVEISSSAAPVGSNYRRTELRGLSGFTGDIRVLENGNFVLWETSGGPAAAVNLPTTTITVESGGFLSILGAAGTPTTTIGTLNGSGTVTKNLGAANHAHLIIAEGGNFSGVISETALNGGATLRLTMDGTGTLVLSGANTYTGQTVISNGTLQIGDGGATGSLNPASSITNNATLAFNRSNTITQGTDFASVISGSGALVQNGTGTLILTGNNTYTGGTTVNSGTLRMVNSATGNAIRGGDSAHVYTVASGATLEFLRTGGTENINRFNLSGGGTFRTNGDILQTSSGSTVAMSSGALIHIESGTYRFGANGVGTWAGNLADLQVDAGATFIGAATPIVVDSLLGAGNIEFNGGLTVGSDNTNGGGTAEFSGIISSGSFDGSSQLTKVGTGTQILSGNNTYTGTTLVSGGVLRITHNNALGSAAAGTTMPGGGSQGTLELAGGIAVSGETLLLQGRNPGNDSHALSNFSGNNSWGGNINLTTGGNQYNIGSQADTLTIGGTITQISGTGNRFLNFLGDGDVNVTGQILNGTASIVLTKTGAGTLTLAGNNNYTGDTFVNAGVLQIGAGGTAGTLGNNSNTTIASGAELRINRTDNFGYQYTGALSGNGTVNIVDGARFDFNNNSQTASGGLAFVIDGTLGVRTQSGVSEVRMGELNGSGTIQRGGNEGGGATLFIGEKNTNSTFAGNIGSAQLGVEKVGTGMLTLSGTNGYGGSTVVSGGTLVINGALTNTSSVTVASGGTLSGSGVITTTGNSTTIGSGSTLAPGDPTMVSGTGTLSLNTSSLTLEPGSFWAVNIAGADHGRLQLNSPASSLDLSGVSLTAGSTSFSPLTNTPYWILDNVGETSLSGMFANIALDGVGANLFPEAPTGFVNLDGTPFAVFLNADFGGNNMFSGGNDILLFAIPEPSKAVLLVIGLLGLLARRR